MDVGNRRINRCRYCLVHAVQKANIGMVAQIACVHAQGFGIICVSLHHIVAKAPCIARGTMLKPGSSPGFFRLVCTRIFLFLDTKKRPKLLKFGRFVYIFVYVLRKTLIFKVYCGERGTKTRNPF